MLQRTHAEVLLADTRALISLPEICIRLRETLADPEHSGKDVADLIVHEPALTTRVLRIVNSAYYGLPRPVRDINHALSVLGEQELHNLVIVTSIVTTLNSAASSLDIGSFWRASIFSAELSANLARHCFGDEAQAQELFMSGLLLNVGKLLLYYHEPELLAQVEQRVADGECADFEAERELLGFDHAELGALMAEQWNFTQSLQENIGLHHHQAFQPQSMQQAIVFLAGYFSDQLDFAHAKPLQWDHVHVQQQWALDQLSLSHEAVCELINTSYEGYLHAYEAFCGGADTQRAQAREA